jgi:DNA-binding NarL/FixJ family response regulator
MRQNTVPTVLPPLSVLYFISAMPRPGARVRPIDLRLRVIIADDHAVIRKQVRSILQESPRFEVCAEAEDGAAAVEEAQRLKPDVVILSVSMPVLNGLEATHEIRTRLPQSSIAISSSNADRQLLEVVKKLMRAHTSRRPKPERPWSKLWKPL